ncbi:MAG: hypothetical protein AAF250_00575 [Pseudomonadota bacterium]
MVADIDAWLMAFGAEYGVNPYVFAAIYLGAIPFFLGSIGWFVRNARAGKSTALPAASAGLFFASSYLYLGIVGHGIPMWVWALVATLVGYGAFTMIRGTRRKIGRRPTINQAP